MNDIFSDEEMKTLWNETSNIDASIILLLCYTGWSINELVRIKRTDVDPDELIMTGGIFKKRVVPVHWALHKNVYLQLYWYGAVMHSEYFVCRKNGEPLSAEELRIRILKTMASFSMHHDATVTRKQFIHMCNEVSIDKGIQDYILGHGFMEIDTDTLRKEIDKLPYKGMLMDVYID